MGSGHGRICTFGTPATNKFYDALLKEPYVTAQRKTSVYKSDKSNKVH